MYPVRWHNQATYLHLPIPPPLRPASSGEGIVAMLRLAFDPGERIGQGTGQRLRAGLDVLDLDALVHFADVPAANEE